MTTEADVDRSPYDRNPVGIRVQYERFLRHVCQQNAQMARLAAMDPDHPETRPQGFLAYDSLIGLQPDEVGTMLSIASDDCHSLSSIDAESFRVRTTQFEQYSSQQLVELNPPELKVLRDQRSALVAQTRAKFHESLGEATFLKLDAWVLRYGRAAVPSQAQLQSPGQTAPGTGSAGATAPHHQSPLRIRYMFFLIHLDREAEHVRFYNSPDGQEAAQRVEAEGGIAPRHRQPYESMIGLSHDQVETMLAVALTGFQAVNEAEQKQVALAKELSSQYTHTQLRQMPPSPIHKRLEEERWAAVEDTVTNLKSALGEKDFNTLDAWVEKHYGGWETLTTQPIGPQQKGASASAQGAGHE